MRRGLYRGVFVKICVFASVPYHSDTKRYTPGTASVVHLQPEAIPSGERRHSSIDNKERKFLRARLSD